jgi:hypothetical protein
MSSHDSRSTTPQGDITDKIYKTWSCVSAFFRSSRHIMNLATNAISRSRGKKPGNTQLTSFPSFCLPLEVKKSEPVAASRRVARVGGASARECGETFSCTAFFCHGARRLATHVSRPAAAATGRSQVSGVSCVRQPVTSKGSHDSGVCQRDGQQPSLFGARNIRPVNSATLTTYVSLTGARSSANMAGRAVRKRPAAEIWPPEPKCVG